MNELINANNPQASSMRWIMLAIILAVSTVIWTTWIVLCIARKEMVDIPIGVVYAYGSTVTVLVTGKVIQSFSEKPALSEKPTTGD